MATETETSAAIWAHVAQEGLYPFMPLPSNWWGWRHDVFWLSIHLCMRTYVHECIHMRPGKGISWPACSSFTDIHTDHWTSVTIGRMLCIAIPVVVEWCWCSWCWLVIAAQLTRWSLVLFGTATQPHYLADYLSSRSLTTTHAQLTAVGNETLATGSHSLSSNSTAHLSMATATVPASTSTGVYCCLHSLWCIIVCSSSSSSSNGGSSGSSSSSSLEVYLLTFWYTVS